jgi:hypothetical protein
MLRPVTFLIFLIIGIVLGFGLRMFWRASKKTSAFTDRVAAARERVAREMANAPAFRDFAIQPGARSYRGRVSWLGQDLPIEVNALERDGLKKLNSALDNFLAHSASLDAQARERIAAETRDANSWLARHLDRPAEDFLAGLAPERLECDDYQVFAIVFRSDMLGGIRVTIEGEMGNDERELIVRGIGLKPGVMPLELDGVAYAVESTKFEVRIATEEWSEEEQRWIYGPDHIATNYSLEIIVNEDSGHDGAPSPMAQSIPVFRAAGGRSLPPAQLVGVEVDDEVDWDAWYGNDAPKLEANHIRFGAVTGNRIHLRWDAKYTWSLHEEPRSFVFEGEVELPVLQVTVKDEADADAFVKASFGEAYFNTLAKEVGEWQTNGDSMPADRRRWLPVTYRPRGGTE